MMKYFNKTTNKINDKMSFFSGDNLIKVLQKSTFGLFNTTINNLGIPTNDFKLPSIIIIGNESSGKSSLIQNILKCQIFPTDKRTCTKVPIKLELITSKDEKFIIIFQNKTIELDKKELILEHIQQIMKELKDDILEDELNIKFYHPEVINNTFYDLPGIREFPENLRTKTKNITNKYINNPNTLIICVIPASATRLTSNQALGMVIDANKCSNCIIALSMIDLLHEDDYEELLINRLLSNNDEITNLNIHKTIGIINKNSTNELDWFNSNIIKFIDNPKIKQEILQHISLNQLLVQIDNLYHNYIRDNWKSQGLEEINKSLIKLENDYKELGDEKLGIIEVLEYIKNEFKFDYKITEPKFGFEESLNYYRGINKDIKLLKKYYDNLKINVYKLSEQIDIIFEKDHIWKIARFNKLKDLIKNFINHIIDSNYKEINEWFTESYKNLKFNIGGTRELYILKDKINMNVNRHIILKLENINWFDIYDYYYKKDDKELEEDNEESEEEYDEESEEDDEEDNTKKNNRWIQHVKQYALNNNVSYKIALQEARTSYKENLKSANKNFDIKIYEDNEYPEPDDEDIKQIEEITKELLVESDDYIRKREELKTKIEKYKSSKEIIKNIENYII